MKDTYSYKGAMQSDSTLKRSLAVFGHNLLGGFVVWLVFFVIVMVFGFMLAMFGY